MILINLQTILSLGREYFSRPDKVVLGVYILFISFSCSCCQTYEEVDTLMTDLQKGYNKHILPAHNQRSKVNVNVDLVVYSLPDIDVLSGLVTFSLTFVISWTDEYLTWNISQYGGLELIRFHSDVVWTPDLLVVSSIDQVVIGSHTVDKIIYRSTGDCLWSTSHVVKNMCLFNMRFWPFDRQHCLMTVIGRSSDLIFSVEPITLSESMGQLSEWDLEETWFELKHTKHLPYITFHFKLSRQPAFYVLTIILPLTAIGLLVPFVFLLPSASGERVGFAVTMMLSMTVFMTIISDNIPSSANPVALVCGYVTMLTISSVVVTMVTIGNLVLCHKNTQTKVGKRWIYIHNVIMCKRWQNKVTASGDISHQHTAIDGNMKLENVDCTLSDEDVKNVPRAIKSNKMEVEILWVDISHCVDRIMFVITTVLIYSSSFGFLLYLSLASDYPQEQITIV